MRDLPVPALVVASGALFATGLWCLLAKRNLVKLVLGVELLGKGASLLFILGGLLAGDLATAQAVVITLIVLEAAVAGVALALAVLARRSLGTLDAGALTTGRGGGQ